MYQKEYKLHIYVCFQITSADESPFVLLLHFLASQEFLPVRSQLAAIKIIRDWDGQI